MRDNLNQPQSLHHSVSYSQLCGQVESADVFAVVIINAATIADKFWPFVLYVKTR